MCTSKEVGISRAYQQWSVHKIFSFICVSNTEVLIEQNKNKYKNSKKENLNDPVNSFQETIFYGFTISQ